MATTVANPNELANPEQPVQTAQVETKQEPVAQPQWRQPINLRVDLLQEVLFQVLQRYSGSQLSDDLCQLSSHLLTAAAFIIAYLWLQQPPYRTVYPGLNEADRQAAYEALTSGDFQAKIDANTGELTVPDSKYHEARIFLAARGLPQGGANTGMDSLNSEASMTTSQFMEQVRYTSAMEQELARYYADCYSNECSGSPRLT